PPCAAARLCASPSTWRASICSTPRRTGFWADMRPDWHALNRILDRIAPDPVLGSQAMGVPGYVQRRLAETPQLGALLEAGISDLAARIDIAESDDARLDAALAKVQNSEWFVAL